MGRRQAARGQGHGERAPRRRPSRDGHDLPRRPGADDAAHDERRGQRPDGEEHVEPVEHRGPARVEVHEQRVDPGVDDARAQPHREEAQQERRPRPRRRDPEEAHRDQARAGGQQQAARQAPGQHAHRHRPGHVDDGVDEVREAHARVVLPEGALDVADERRDEQDGPAQQEEGGEPGHHDVAAGGGRAGSGLGGGGLGHGAPGWKRRSRRLRPGCREWWAILDSNQ